MTDKLKGFIFQLAVAVAIGLLLIGFKQGFISALKFEFVIGTGFLNASIPLLVIFSFLSHKRIYKKIMFLLPILIVCNYGVYLLGQNMRNFLMWNIIIAGVFTIVPLMYMGAINLWKFLKKEA